MPRRTACPQACVKDGGKHDVLQQMRVLQRAEGAWASPRVARAGQCIIRPGNSSEFSFVQHACMRYFLIRSCEILIRRHEHDYKYF